MEFKGTPSLIYNALGTLYESMGNQEKALDFFKSALDVKKTPLAMMNIANTFMRMGALEKAEKYYLMIDETDSSLTPIFNYNIAIFFYKTEKYDEALKRIDRAISGGREDYLVRYTKASILVKLNRFTEALEIFGSLKHERPGDARLYKNMGVIYELYTRDMARALQNYVGYIGIVGQSNAGAVQQWADVVRAIISRQGGSATGGGSDE
jgi:tetratricopeptide (TPR) repeat protein